MKCPLCHHPESRVARAAPANNGETMRRRRECLKCRHRWNTFENNEDAAAELHRLKQACAPVAAIIKGN
jgi:transcriptional regulator NrdR family protein